MTIKEDPPIDIQKYRARKSLLRIGEDISKTFGPQPFLYDIVAFNELLRSGSVDVKTIPSGRSLGVKLTHEDGGRITVYLRASLLDMDFAALKTKRKTSFFLVFDDIAHKVVINHTKQNANAASA